MIYNEIINPAATEMGEASKKKQPQVLIIDDEVDVCYLLKSILKQKSIEATYVTTLAEGEILLAEYEPPVIFLDNHLPDGFGVDYVRLFKREHPSSRIVMLTAHDTFADKERAYREGVDFFISKPFTRNIILKTIEKII
ncbi:MAG TPA: response regulator [Chitinophagaceae bacterium]|nr:response regulator [Chitinophagaceae bacterium]